MMEHTYLYKTLDWTLDALLWESYNPALGTLRGCFEIVGDSIISHYRSEDGVYCGTKTLVRKSPTEYYNAGISFCEGRRMSSRTANLSAH